MDLYAWVVVAGSALLGLAVGSFIAARVMRTAKSLPQGLFGRSQCLSCNKLLTFRDLVPVFSYLFLRGRCRHCKGPFPATYMGIELTTAILFALVVGVSLATGLFPMPIEGAATATFFLRAALVLSTLSILVYISALDLQIMAFPVVAVGGMTTIHLLSTLLFGYPTSFLDALSGGIAFAGILALVRLVGSLLRGVEAMGDGDIWVAGLIGASLGLTSTVVAFYGTFLLGALAAVVLLVRRKQSNKPAVLPFAPFLAMGWLLGVLWGKPLFLLLFPF